MPKVVIEVEDLAGGELSVRFLGDGLATAATAQTNTAAQNIAIFLSTQLRGIGVKAPNLSGE